MRQAFITVNNSYQNIGSTMSRRPVGNLSVENPTVEQLNEAISQGQQRKAPDAPVGEEHDAPFGTHIREAVSIVKDWVRPK